MRTPSSTKPSMAAKAVSALLAATLLTGTIPARALAQDAGAQASQQQANVAVDADGMNAGLPQPGKNYDPKYVDFSVAPDGAYCWKIKKDCAMSKAFFKMGGLQSCYHVDRDVVFDLDGHTLTPEVWDKDQDLNMFTIGDNGHLTIKDTSPGKRGKINVQGCYEYGSDRRLAEIPNGVTGNPTVVVDGVCVECGCALDDWRQGGTIRAMTGTVVLKGTARIVGNQGFKGGSVYISGPNTHFIMEGSSSIEGCLRACVEHGGGVYATDGATFTMRDRALIENCEAERSPNQGGGVYASNGATINMEGGTIRNCWCSRGGGVFMANGATMNMTGGCITGCKVDRYGGGVYLADSGKPSKLNQTGGTISGNKASRGGNDVYIEKR